MLKGSSKDQLFKEKVYISLLTGVQIFNILDFVIILPMGPMLMRYFSISPFEFAALASSYSFSSAIVSFLYSSFADKYDRKKLLLICLAGFILATFICAIAPTYISFLGARVIAGTFGGVLTPCVYAIVAELIPFERRGKALGTVMASFSLTSVLGIPTGLWIADTYGWRHAFHFIGAGATVVFFFNIYFLPFIPQAPFNLKSREILARIIKIAINKDYRSAFISIFLMAFSGFLLFPFIAPYAVKNVGIQESELKFIYLVGGIFTIFASKFTGILTDKFGSLKLFFPTLFLSFISIHLYTTVENISLSTLLIISTSFMVLINARFIPVMKLITECPDAEDRGSFMGFLMSVRNLASGAGPLVAGLIITETPESLENFNYSGYLSIFIGLIAIYFVLKMNRYIGSKQNASTD